MKPKPTLPTPGDTTPEGQHGPFEAMFTQMWQQTISDANPPIPREELKASFFNGRGNIAHDKCGCPGSVMLLPTSDGHWFCTTCKGYTTAEIASEVIAKDREDSLKKFKEHHGEEDGAMWAEVFLGVKR